MTYKKRDIANMY